jgi:hypothetical protein
MRPRFRTEREDWVQRVVADGHAICILPERSAAAPGLITRPIEGLSLERELVLATVSGSNTPVEIRKIAQLASLLLQSLAALAVRPFPRGRGVLWGIWSGLSEGIRRRIGQ